MSFWGHVADVATGGIYSAAGGSGGFGDDIKGALNGGGGPDPAPAAPPAPDYSGLELVESNNSKTTAEAQIMTQSMALQQAGLDQELKHAADTELQLATFDTKMQTSLLEYKQGMVSEQNRHIERMYAQGHQEYRMLTQTGLSLDLPPPSDPDPSKKSA